MTLHKTIRAHEITEGMLIIPSGRKLPVEVLGMLCRDGEHIEFGCIGRGKVALRLHRDELVEVVQDEQPCCDGTGWTGNQYDRCTEHYEPLDAIWFAR